MRIIFNGDDFGYSRGVNIAMIDCYEKGVMKSCSLMVNMPGAEEAAKMMKEHPGLSVGIHLTLTVGKPITPNLRTLIKENGNFNKGMLMESGHVDQEEIRTELRAQMNRYIELTGHLPAHINSHHGICKIQGAEEVVCELANEYDLPVRHFLTSKNFGSHPRLAYEIPELRDVEMNKRTKSGEDIIALFTQKDIDSDQVFEVPAHPGYVDVGVIENSSLTVGRAWDAYSFLDPVVKEWLENNHIENMDYTQLRKIK